MKARDDALIREQGLIRSTGELSGKISESLRLLSKPSPDHMDKESGQVGSTAASNGTMKFSLRQDVSLHAGQKDRFQIFSEDSLNTSQVRLGSNKPLVIIRNTELNATLGVNQDLLPAYVVAVLDSLQNLGHLEKYSVAGQYQEFLHF